MLFCNSLCRAIIAFALTLPLTGCAGFFAVPSGDMEAAPEHVSSLPSDVDVRQLSRQSPPMPNPTADAPFVSDTPSDGGPGVLAGLTGGRRSIVAQSEINYENATLTEDVTWHGSVLVRGYLVIAPQATVRIEPGTVVRFMKSPILRQAPRLVVMGRLHSSGTTERPVLFAPNVAEAAPGDWGGILLLSSEKHNQFDHVRIEGATTGIDARFSTFAVTESEITRSAVGMLLRDSTARLAAVSVDACETGLEAFDSELDLRNSSFDHNRRGIGARRTTLILQSVSVKNSEQQGIFADECRIRFNSCDLSGNVGGVRLGKAEGQIIRSRFVGNRGVGLVLESSRLKIHQSLFADTVGDGIRMDDGQSVIWESAFDGNSGYNLVNSGRESISAVRNWWGSNHETAISDKLFNAAKDTGSGQILFFPWLPEKPAAAP
jgi:hypothetical protein